MLQHRIVISGCSGPVRPPLPAPLNSAVRSFIDYAHLLTHVRIPCDPHNHSLMEDRPTLSSPFYTRKLTVHRPRIDAREEHRADPRIPSLLNTSTAFIHFLNYRIMHKRKETYKLSKSWHRFILPQQKESEILETFTKYRPVETDFEVTDALYVQFYQRRGDLCAVWQFQV